jgi:hypothetical protein
MAISTELLPDVSEDRCLDSMYALGFSINTAQITNYLAKFNQLKLENCGLLRIVKTFAAQMSYVTSSAEDEEAVTGLLDLISFVWLSARCTLSVTLTVKPGSSEKIVAETLLSLPPLTQTGSNIIFPVLIIIFPVLTADQEL